MEKQKIFIEEKLLSFVVEYHDYLIIVMSKNNKIIGFFTGLKEIIENLPKKPHTYYCIKKIDEEGYPYFNLKHIDRGGNVMRIDNISRSFPNGPSVCSKAYSKFLEEGYSLRFILEELESSMRISQKDSYIPAIIFALKEIEKKLEGDIKKQVIELELKFEK